MCIALLYVHMQLRFIPGLVPASIHILGMPYKLEMSCDMGSSCVEMCAPVIHLPSLFCHIALLQSDTQILC